MLAFLALFFGALGTQAACTIPVAGLNLHHNGSLVRSTGPNSCVTFSVGAGTGCGWMCSYCANQLGTNNYYFTDSVCTYEPGGCVGNPQASTDYTCCTA